MDQFGAKVNVTIADLKSGCYQIHVTVKLVIDWGVGEGQAQFK